MTRKQKLARKFLRLETLEDRSLPSTLTDNFTTNVGTRGARGGGIYNAGTLVISGSTLSGNSAGGPNVGNSDGGGIYNAGTLTVGSSTLSNNSAAFGGGIYNDSSCT